MRSTDVWEGAERLGLRQRSRRMERSQPGQRPDPSLPAGTDRLPQIKHIVVLMMENHSFDNYLGTLAGRGEGLPAGEDGQPDVLRVMLDATGSRVVLRQFPPPDAHRTRLRVEHRGAC